MRLKIFVSLLFIVSFFSLYAQVGTIRGTVFDKATGELLPGVTVFVEGTTKGTMTDLDGKFNLNMNPGVYSMRISFISYETILLNDVIVTSDNVTLLDNLGLEEATIAINEVTVTAEQIRNTENALLAIKRKSPNLLDGISASNLRKIGDSDVASSMKRVPGVSVSGGKYVFVRGLGDRYTKTTLNGLDIPGLDPDRNTVQMDIFPTNIIDNIIVHKSFSAELPADFTGGVIDIELKDFPETKKASVSLSGGYNPGSHFNSNYLTYEGSSTDMLGFDNGFRDIPAIEDVPQRAYALANPDGKTGLRYREILASFEPTMATMQETSFMDYSIGASYGNQVPKEKVTLGYNFALSYKNTTDYYEGAEYGKYGLNEENEGDFEMERREYKTGNFGENNVLLSGLAGFAIKTNTSKYRINLLHLQNGESRAGLFDLNITREGSEFVGVQHVLEYSQRSLTNLLIDGKHIFGDSKWTMEWKISPTLSILNDPDIRTTGYKTDPNNPTSFIIGSGESGFPKRTWRELQELNVASYIHVTREYRVHNKKAKLNFGAASTYKNREFSIRSYVFHPENIALTGNPNELFDAESLWPANGDITAGTYYDPDFVPHDRNSFDASAIYAAGYLSTELYLFEALKTTAGVRAESYTQYYTGTNNDGTIKLDNEKVLDDLDFFPTINFIYSLSDKQNLRASYSRTIARPSFKEMSFAEIYDPISNSSFSGGLFPDNDPNGNEVWDGNLSNTYINNMDVRWEMFFRGGQMFSLSGFYKTFEDPIEIVQYTKQKNAFQPRNVGDGEVLGVETEFRLSLNFIDDVLSPFLLSSNVTVTRSRIQLSATEYESRQNIARTGQEVDEYRDMAGQAPFIVNAGFAYNGGNRGFLHGLEAGLYYNMQGTTLEIVGAADKPDIYTMPFHSLNFNTNKKLGENQRLQVGLKIENILDSQKESKYQSFKAVNQIYKSLVPGRTFTLKLTYNFF